MADQENIRPIALATKFNYRRNSYYQDSYVKNGFLEQEVEGAYTVKRPGFRLLIDLLNRTGYTPAIVPPVTGIEFQGGFTGVDVSSGTQVIYFAIQGRIFKTTLSRASYPLFIIAEYTGSGMPLDERMQTTAPLTGEVPWQGVNAIYRAFTPIIPFGVGLVPSLCELDRTFYVLDVNGNILASALGDIATWPALNTIVAFPAKAGITLTRHLQYIVAFSVNEIKVYYDAGISPGAPIAQETSFHSEIGVPYAAAQAIQSSSDVLYWLGQTTEEGLGVYMMSGLQIKKISTPEVDRFLEDNFAPWIEQYGISYQKLWYCSGIYAMVVQSGGHSFYALTAPATIYGSGTSIVYDITTGVWYLWDQVTTGWPGTELKGTRNLGLNLQGMSFILSYQDARIYTLDTEYYQDGGNPITFEVQTASYDWGTPQTKLIAATYVSSDTVSSTYQLSWTDDDYTTYSTPQTISANQAKKKLVRCGSTVERAWRLTHTDNTPMRFYELQVEVKPGAL